MEKLMQELEVLKLQKTQENDFGKQMDLADKIHNIKMKINGTKPMHTEIECIGCGS